MAQPDERHTPRAMPPEETAALAAMLYVRMAVRDPVRPESRHVDFEFPLDEWRVLLDRALDVALMFQDVVGLEDRVCRVTKSLMEGVDHRL